MEKCLFYSHLFPGKERNMFTVNGTKKELQGVFSVKEYLEQNGYVISQIAVELNEEILPKTEYVSTVLKDGDVMEIVSFMGGGSC
jgi:thiamine biosynthesis protein ThiS